MYKYLFSNSEWLYFYRHGANKTFFMSYYHQVLSGLSDEILDDIWVQLENIKIFKFTSEIFNFKSKHEFKFIMKLYKHSQDDSLYVTEYFRNHE